MDDGAVQGDPDQEASVPEFPEGSNIGTPDMVFAMNEPYSLTGNYQDDYRCFIFPIRFICSESINCYKQNIRFQKLSHSNKSFIAYNY